MTVADLILKDIRPFLGDENSNTWTDSDLLNKVNSSRRQLYADAPFAFSKTSVVITAPSDLTLSDTLDVSDFYISPLAHRVCFLAFSEDSQDAANAALAASHHSIYRGGL